MANEIISYLEMCTREGTSLQQGMNFRLGRGYSVILMSLRPNAPYADRFDVDGSTLIYEGHDAPKVSDQPSPKQLDQPEFYSGGSLTQNGKFHRAAQEAKAGTASPERVRVYEKIRPGIWSYNGVFHLLDSWTEKSGSRIVFKFKLVAVADEVEAQTLLGADTPPRRVIPTAVKLEVWKRDGGCCTICQATDELHFDHMLPFAKGGTSISAANVQLLCARNNLAKGDRIE
jgi:hypothetical protein